MITITPVWIVLDLEFSQACWNATWGPLRALEIETYWDRVISKNAAQKEVTVAVVEGRPNLPLQIRGSST